MISLFKEAFSKYKDEFVEGHFPKAWQQVVFYAFIFSCIVVMIRIVIAMIFPSIS